MNLNEMRMIVQSNMPYDTGFMFMSGAKFQENNHFIICRYDTETVPYIIYNEEGTKYTEKNKGFISKQTVGELNRMAQFMQHGMKTKLQDDVKRRASTNMVKEGALEKIKQEGRLYGY